MRNARKQRLKRRLRKRSYLRRMRMKYGTTRLERLDPELHAKFIARIRLYAAASPGAIRFDAVGENVYREATLKALADFTRPREDRKR